MCSDCAETKSCGSRRRVVFLVVELGVEPYDASRGNLETS
jgi:hypothetical protein